MLEKIGPVKDAAREALKSDPTALYELMTAPTTKILDKWFESEPLKVMHSYMHTVMLVSCDTDDMNSSQNFITFSSYAHERSTDLFESCKIDQFLLSLAGNPGDGRVHRRHDQPQHARQRLRPPAPRHGGTGKGCSAFVID